MIVNFFDELSRWVIRSGEMWIGIIAATTALVLLFYKGPRPLLAAAGVLAVVGVFGAWFGRHPSMEPELAHHALRPLRRHGDRRRGADAHSTPSGLFGALFRRGGARFGRAVRPRSGAVPGGGDRDRLCRRDHRHLPLRGHARSANWARRLRSAVLESAAGVDRGRRSGGDDSHRRQQRLRSAVERGSDLTAAGTTRTRSDSRRTST